MKTIVSLFATAIMLLWGMTLNGQESKNDKLETVQFITSMTCEACVNTIMDNLPREKGVKDVRTDLANKTVTITFLKDKNTADKLKRSIEKLGYTAKLIDPKKEKK